MIESVSVHGPSVTIKSHHNVGGLPDVMKLKLVEPLRSLFKDEELFLRNAPQELNAKIFVSVGSLEGFEMIPMMKKMTKSIRDHAFIGLKIEERIFENESHTSVVTTALNQGIRALYKEE